MQNYSDQSQDYDYRGKRGLILLRVSTEEQEKKYGFPSQLREIMEKVVTPRGIRILDPDKYIKYDTYTGMEFREREILTEILEMAKRGEFDVLIMDVLDRLGRVGLPREIYRAELRMHNIRTLTTKPEEHADDDSLMGQMIRLLHGFKSEQERDDIIRRTMNGTRERILKDHKLPGAGTIKYGWKCPNGDRDTYVANEDPLIIDEIELKDENGYPWTEAKVRCHMFYMMDHGHTIRSVASYLTQQHIPTRKGSKWDIAMVKQVLANKDRYLSDNKPVLAYGLLVVLDENKSPYTWTGIASLICQMKEKGVNLQEIAAYLTSNGIPTGKEAYWHKATVVKMLKDEAVIGRAIAYKTKVVREEGSKRRQVPREQSQWVYLPDGVIEPILVTEDGKPDIALFERVQNRLVINKQAATRNNHDPHAYLLRGGFIKCGYCGANMSVGSIGRYDEQGVTKKSYHCPVANTSVSGANRCPSASRVVIVPHIADNYAWSKAVEIIRDPFQVDQVLEAWKKEDPNADRRQHITSELAKIKASRARLTKRLEDEDLDDDTYADIKRRLKELKDQKEGYERELTKEINIHDEWMKAQERLKHFHKRCQEMREKLDDPNYEPDYEFKRDAIEYFDIIVRVWKTDHKPRMEAVSSIVSTLLGRKRLPSKPTFRVPSPKLASAGGRRA
jgi:DNA invertase Pin-like site-specific DNA recombinase